MTVVVAHSNVEPMGSVRLGRRPEAHHPIPNLVLVFRSTHSPDLDSRGHGQVQRGMDGTE